MTIFSSCNSPYPELKDTFDLAGKNKNQLIEVLDHYKQSGDSLKFQAAYFLIKYMPGKGTITSKWINDSEDEFEIDISKYPNLQALRSSMDSAGYYQIHTGLKEDCQYITADYLIKNIEQSFFIWENIPWAKKVNFETFCNYILPHRIGTEKLEDWKELIYNKYYPVISKIPLDSILNHPLETVELKVGFQLSYDHGNLIRALSPDLSYSELIKNRIAQCEGYTLINMYHSRALGIPASNDFIPVLSGQNGSHMNCTALDTVGINNTKRGITRWKQNKIFRKTYASYESYWHTFPEEALKPVSFLKSKYVIDVTGQHYKTFEIDLHFANLLSGDEYVYLAIFNYGKWRPVVVNKVDTEKNVYLKDLPTAIVYTPCVKRDRRMIPLSDPFVIDETGNVKYFTVDKKNTTSISVNRKAIVQKTQDIGLDTSFYKLHDQQIYTLYYWDNKWEELAEGITDSTGVRFENIPTDGLYRITNLNRVSKNEARIFYIDDKNSIVWR